MVGWLYIDLCVEDNIQINNFLKEFKESSIKKKEFFFQNFNSSLFDVISSMVYILFFVI